MNADRVYKPPARDAVESALHAAAEGVASAKLAAQFARAEPADVLEILKTLEILGHAGHDKFRR